MKNAHKTCYYEGYNYQLNSTIFSFIIPTAAGSFRNIPYAYAVLLAIINYAYLCPLCDKGIEVNLFQTKIWVECLVFVQKVMKNLYVLVWCVVYFITGISTIGGRWCYLPVVSGGTLSPL